MSNIVCFHFVKYFVLLLYQLTDLGLPNTTVTQFNMQQSANGI
jgi:hypothetical protein